MPHDTSAIADVTTSANQVKLDDTFTILLVGVGGQGTILAGNILAMCAADAGLDVKVSEIHGMSQRGGSVSTVIRVGSDVDSMVVDPGCADVVVAFEAVEALRAQQYLKADGTMFVNDEKIVPVSVHTGGFTMPDDVDERLESIGAIVIPAAEIAREAGSPRSTNVVLVGAISLVLSVDEDLWKDAISKRVPAHTVEANLDAFARGRAVAAAKLEEWQSARK